MKDGSLRIGLACGGTGGHVFPGLATAEALQSRHHEVTLWLSGKDVEQEAVKNWSGSVVTVPAQGFSSGLSIGALGVAWTLYRARRNCIRIMKKQPPDVLLGMGSYACVGPASAAVRLGVPLVLHEANVLPGKAVSLMSRWADTVAASFEETRYYLKRKDIVITGMPLRSELEVGAAASPVRPDHHHSFTVLVMGGSRGATSINDVASTALCELHQGGYAINVIHLAGHKDTDKVQSAYEKAGISHEVHSFVHDMASAYSRADLTICRAGASTCAEISAFGVPALLVPYPFAAKDHQTLNARALEKIQAADVVAEKALSIDWLQEYVVGCLENPGRLARTSAAAKSRTVRSASESLADLVENVARKNKT